MIASTLLSVGDGYAQVRPIRIEPGGDIIDYHLHDLDHDGTDEIIVTSRLARTEQRTISIYVIDSAGESQSQVGPLDIPDDVVAYGLGNLLAAQRDQIIYFTSKSVFALDPWTENIERVMDAEQFFFSMTTPRSLLFWDYITDINGDGNDDLILAKLKHFEIYLQDSPKSFRLVGKIEGESGFSKRSRTLGASGGRSVSTRRSLGRLEFGDLNGDGKIDLLEFDGNRIKGYYQSDEGTFAARPDIRQRIDSGGASDSFRGQIDGDGKLDIIFAKADARDMATKITVHLTSGEGLPEKPTQPLKISGLGNDIELSDVNGDGLNDFGILTLRADKLLDAALSTKGTIDATYYVFLFDAETGQFSRRPDAKHEISFPLDGNSQRDPSDQFVLIGGDFNGDGIKDLLQFDNDNRLEIFYASMANKMSLSFANRPSLEYEIQRPDRFDIADLNGDGKSDLILRFDRHLELWITE